MHDESIVVAKFGGTSVKDGRSIESIISDIVSSDERRRVLVFSAPGKRESSDYKVTDLILGIAEQSYARSELPGHDIGLLRDRFESIANYLGLDPRIIDSHMGQFSENLASVYPDKQKYLDQVAPFGEILISKLIAQFAIKQGLNAQAYMPQEIGMLTDGNFGRAKLLHNSYAQVAASLRDELASNAKIAIIPGFYGIDEGGNFTTLGRDGSNTTGAFLSRALDACLYENWTDTPVRRADPRIIPSAKTVNYLTYDEAEEIVYAYPVLHPDTFVHLVNESQPEMSIPLVVKNTFDPRAQGTYISSSKPAGGTVIEAITCKDGFTILNLRKRGMNPEHGYLRKVDTIFDRHGISIDHTSTSIGSYAVAIPTNGSIGSIRSAAAEIEESGLVNRTNGLSITEDNSMVCVVGEGMRNKLGMLSELTGTLSRAGININYIFHAFEGSIIFAVSKKDSRKAVETLYNSYFADHSNLS